MSQLFFSFTNEERYLEDEFVLLDENLAARNFLQKFFDQKDFSSSHLQSLIIKGAEGSGKTHLLNIFSKKFGGKFLDGAQISALNPAESFVKNHFYILEDFDQIKDEESLLRLINSTREAKAFLLMSVDKKTNFKLKDLNSRLKNIVTVEIKNPGIKALEQLLMNRLARRQIRPSSKSIKSALSKIELKYSAIDEVIGSLS